MKNALMRQMCALLFACVTVASLLGLLILNIRSVHAASSKQASTEDCKLTATETQQSRDKKAYMELDWGSQSCPQPAMAVFVQTQQKNSIHVVITSQSIWGHTHDGTNYDVRATTVYDSAYAYNYMTPLDISPNNSFFYPTFQACVYIRGEAPLCTDYLNSSDGKVHYKRATGLPKNCRGTITVTHISSGSALLPLEDKVSVYPCTLSYIIKNGGNTASTHSAVKVVVIRSAARDFSLPGANDGLSTEVQWVVLNNAGDLLNKDRTCPHPSNGVYFNLPTPDLRNFVPGRFEQTEFIYGKEFFHPAATCA